MCTWTILTKGLTVQELPEVKSAPPPAVSALGDVIVNVVELGTVITWQILSSKSDAEKPVPLGKVTASNKTIPPTLIPCAAEVVIVTVVVEFVESVAPVILVFKGVISKSWPSK